MTNATDLLRLWPRLLLNSCKSKRFSAPDGQTPTSATFTVVDRWEAIGISKDDPSMNKDDYGERTREGRRGGFWEKTVIARSGGVVHEKRRKMSRGKNLQVVNEDMKADKATTAMATTATHLPMFFRMTIQILPTIPSYSPSSSAHSDTSLLIAPDATMLSTHFDVLRGMQKTHQQDHHPRG